MIIYPYAPTMLNRARDRNFQAAVLRKLYPLQPFDDHEDQLPHNDTLRVEQEQIIEAPETVGDVPSEDQTNPRVSDSSDSGESIDQHLTRAQRKRIRKRKMKEAASSSKKLIGPLLPDNYVQENFTTETPKCLDLECSSPQSQTECTILDAVRSAEPSEGLDSGLSTCHGKLKQRRHAKKLNHESAKSAQRENSSKVFVAESCETGYVLKHL